MAETTAHTEVPGAKRPFPPFESQHFPSQLFWLALTFILLYVLMSRIALPRIGRILDNRSKHIANDLAAAQRFKDQSDAANTAYQKSLADARARAQAIAPVTSLQPPYSMLSPEIEAAALPFCAAHNIGVIVYSPMSSGLLTGRMTRERIQAIRAFP